MTSLYLLHISDLHFRTDEVSPWDPHVDVRAAVLRNVEAHAAKRNIDGIVVTGDIAYSGKTEQYALARGWMTRLMDASKCSVENIRMVPGNHDVDRAVQQSDRMLGDAIARLRRQEGTTASRSLSEYAKTNGEQMFSGLL